MAPGKRRSRGQTPRTPYELIEGLRQWGRRGGARDVIYDPRAGPPGKMCPSVPMATLTKIKRPGLCFCLGVEAPWRPGGACPTVRGHNRPANAADRLVRARWTMIVRREWGDLSPHATINVDRPMGPVRPKRAPVDTRAPMTPRQTAGRCEEPPSMAGEVSASALAAIWRRGGLVYAKGGDELNDAAGTIG